MLSLKQLKHLFILTILTLSGCSLDDTIPIDELIPRKDFVLTRSDLDFIYENNGFALELFKKVAQKEGNKSLVISPLSVTLDFGMVNNGAVGETRDEINNVIGFKDGSVEEFNSFCKSMMTQSCQVDPTTTLEFANASVVNSFFVPLKKDFTQRIKDYYSAEVVYKDFFTEDIKGIINSWCDKKTKGMIKELIHDPVPPDDYAHFLTATYFKGIWSNQFKKSDTKKESFFCEDGNEVEVRMMHQKSGFRLSGLSGLGSAIVLPYGNEAFRMILLLPSEGKTIKDILDKFDAESWAELIDYLTKHLGVSNEIDVKIPVFETEYESSLREVLRDMGIHKAFTDEADFSGMTDEKTVFINDVKQKTRIKVDEQGSEAAAVVDMSLKGGMSLYPEEPKVLEFHADHPFIYAITEVSSGAIFFIGQYTGK